METQWKLMASVITVILFTGCGNDLATHHPLLQDSSNQTQTALPPTGLQASEGYSCPQDQRAQIKPQFDRRLDRTGYYTVCAHDTVHGKIELLGEPSATTSEICIFPAQEKSESEIYPRLDPYRQGTAYSHCYAIAPGPRTLIEFQGLEYNAAFVVPKSARDLMARCLATGLWEQCPDFSYGKFRELPSDRSENNETR